MPVPANSPPRVFIQSSRAFVVGVVLSYMLPLHVVNSLPSTYNVDDIDDLVPAVEGMLEIQQAKPHPVIPTEAFR